MSGLPVNWNDPAVRAAMSRMGKEGGRSRSEAKRTAARENQKKAVARRLEKRRQGHGG